MHSFTTLLQKTSKISFVHVNPFLHFFYVILQDTGPWIAHQQSRDIRKTLTLGCKFGLMITNTEFIHLELS